MKDANVFLSVPFKLMSCVIVKKLLFWIHCKLLSSLESSTHSHTLATFALLARTIPWAGTAGVLFDVPGSLVLQ